MQGGGPPVSGIHGLEVAPTPEKGLTYGLKNPSPPLPPPSSRPRSKLKEQEQFLSQTILCKSVGREDFSFNLMRAFSILS